MKNFTRMKQNRMIEYKQKLPIGSFCHILGLFYDLFYRRCVAPNGDYGIIIIVWQNGFNKFSSAYTVCIGVSYVAAYLHFNIVEC